jgi:hypothetical protein
MRPNNETNIKHALNPEPGDYWHEMFTPIMVVLDVTSMHVVICDGTKPADKDRWSWDYKKIKCLTRKEFNMKPRYDSPKLIDHFHCDVMPNAHVDVACDYHERNGVKDNG